MAKKQKAEVAAEEPIMVAPPKKVVKPQQYKDKLYELSIGETPISYVLRTRCLLWFDESVGYER